VPNEDRLGSPSAFFNSGEVWMRDCIISQCINILHSTRAIPLLFVKMVVESQIKNNGFVLA
jgi:hypothetical protein